MGAALEIRIDLASSTRLQALARRERRPRTATRMLAIAAALEGRSRAEAAWQVGI
jgi:predicted transcriptional regulator